MMRLRGPKLLARKYIRPEMIGSIHVPEAYATDHSRSLWEVVESSPDADKLLKISLLPSWILVTPRNSGVYLESRGVVDIFLLAASSVRRIIPWTTENEDVKMKGARVLVKPDAVAKASPSGIIIAAEAWAKRPVTGRVVEVGNEVKDPEIREGLRVLYGIHAGTALTVNGVDHMILEESQVLAWLEEGDVVEVA